MAKSSSSSDESDGDKGMVGDSTESSSPGPQHGGKRFFSDAAAGPLLNCARKEYELAVAGSQWLKHEKTATQAVAKATYKHMKYRSELQSRALKIARKNSDHSAGTASASAGIAGGPIMDVLPGVAADPPPVAADPPPVATPPVATPPAPSTATHSTVLRVPQTPR